QPGQVAGQQQAERLGEGVATIRQRPECEARQRQPGQTKALRYQPPDEDLTCHPRCPGKWGGLEGPLAPPSLLAYQLISTARSPHWPIGGVDRWPGRPPEPSEIARSPCLSGPAERRSRRGGGMARPRLGRRRWLAGTLP